MNYHKISYDDQLNGEGLRVVVFLSGCNHHCPGCQNPQTWDPKSGQLFDDDAMREIDHYLEKDYISGITLSGGDPFFKDNLSDVTLLLTYVKAKYPTKNIWVYTGYNFDDLYFDEDRRKLLEYIDVLVVGPFVEKLLDNNYKWAGSTNQKIIDVQATLGKYKNLSKDDKRSNREKKIVHYESK